MNFVLKTMNFALKMITFADFIHKDPTAILLYVSVSFIYSINQAIDSSLLIENEDASVDKLMKFCYCKMQGLLSGMASGGGPVSMAMMVDVIPGDMREQGFPIMALFGIPGGLIVWFRTIH